MSDQPEVSPSRESLRGLDWLNFFLADTQTGVGPFLAIYLASGLHWNDQRVGITLSVAGVAGVLAQGPAGAIVDSARRKRTVVMVGVLAIVAAALIFANSHSFAALLTGQIMLGSFGAVFAPALNGISLGLVGAKLLDWRVGRNQFFNSAGNVAAAVSMGLLGYYVSSRAIFFAVPILAVPTLLSLFAIRPQEIDYDRSRGAQPASGGTKVSSFGALLADRGLMIFCVAVFLFHFANAAMLPQLGEMLARGKGRQSALFMGACVIVTQLVISMTAPWFARRAQFGRKPLLLLGFGVLPLRGLLYTATTYAPLLIGIQILDGIANSIYLVVGVLVIADLTRGSGHFNLMLGTMATAQGIGAAASTTFAGAVVHHAGYDAGFLSLAAVAMFAVLLVWWGVPESATDKKLPMLTSPSAA